jgi:pSer/pThr/pTyr-binding forkhead associated (FHA) protein
VVEGPHAGRAFAFDQHDTFFVGRSVKAQFSLPRQDRYFSRMHFLVEVNPPLVRVMDLGSRNGTFVNDSRIESADLQHGDRIKAGKTVLEVTISPKADGDYLLRTEPGGIADELAARFEQEWLAGRGPRMEDFLSAASSAARASLMRELVLLDMEMRLEAGDPVRVEDYLKRFPELKSEPKWIANFLVAECTFRRVHEPTLNIEEFMRRFPALRDELVERLRPSRSEATTFLPRDGRTVAGGEPRIPGYRLEEELGRGGMGVVYRARDHDAHPVAVKVISPAVAAGPTAVQRFLREADTLRRLKHRHIIGFRAMGEADGFLWFAMDLVQGADAAKIVNREGPFDPKRATRLILPVLGALAYAHAEGFVHRDIKPANLLVTKTSEAEEALLADFGLARTYEASRLSGLTVAGSLAGTPLYMPPEQVLSLREVKPAADQYSAAATFYFMLTGKAPYDPDPNSQLQFMRVLEEPPIQLLKRRPDLPASLAVVIERAMAREPADRYANVMAFSAALRPFAGFV